jgi:recombinational DNA repair protein (RecF pathway)
MSGPALRCLVLGRDASGESHDLLTLLEPEEGLLRCLLRRRRAGAGDAPDLFDEAEVTLEKSKDGGTRFARDYRLSRRRTGIGRDRRALERASRLAGILRRNPPPPESAPVCWKIAQETFDAIATRPRPDAAYFKALWLILKDGGWPVHEHWFSRLGARQADAAAVLAAPLDAQTADEDAVAALSTDLERWAAGEVHYVLP